MTKIIIFTVCILLYLLTQPSLAMTDTEKCKTCHGTIIPIPKQELLKNCDVCHITHGCDKNCLPVPLPPPEKIHKIHEDAGRRQPKVYGGCSDCHKSPVVCTNCHNSHKNVNISANDTNATVCTNCHGNLPKPMGHGDFRKSISENKHQWMTCSTCHIRPYKIEKDYKFELGFKDLLVTPINDSIGLCKICHSFQYERLQINEHGKQGDKCINCHNPHTTQLGGPKFQTTPKETPANISSKVQSTREWITTKIPLLNNVFAVYIIFILIIVAISEYLLSRHEEGTKLVHHIVKIQEREDFLRTLEIELLNQNIENLNSLLEEMGIHILGMTMEKQHKDKEEYVYKYVLFVGTDNIISEEDEKGITDAISSISNVKSVVFTDKYEL